MEKKKADQKIDLWRAFQIAATSALVIIYIFQWIIMISISSQRTSADFKSFYTAGRIAQDQGISSVYKITAQQDAQQLVVGFHLTKDQVLPYNHIPYLIPFLKLLVNDNYVGSFVRWTILMLGIYIVGSIFFLNNIFIDRKNKVYLALMMGTLTFLPFSNSLLVGQDTALLFLATGMWCIGILKKRDWLAAIGLALTTLRPHLCLVFAIPLLFRYRKVWWRFFIIAGLLALSSIIMLGRDGTLSFFNILLISASGSGHGTNESGMLNLIGLTLRTLPFIQSDIIRILGWVGYAAGIGIVSFLWIKARELDSRLLGISIIIALLCVPHLHYHDLTLLIIPLIFAVTLPTSVAPPERIALLPLSISLLLLLDPLYFILPYILYASLVWWLTKAPRTIVVMSP